MVKLKLLQECIALEGFWEAGLNMQPRRHPAFDTFAWIYELMGSLNRQQVEQLFMLLCVIWNERNNCVWNGGAFNPIFRAECVTRHLEEYQKFHPPKTKAKRRQETHWKCPPRGRLKINVDGAFHADLAQGGVVVVVRDELGICIAAFARSLAPMSSALQAEAEACRAGLLISIHQGWMDIELERDCAMVAAALACPDEECSEIDRVMEDCKD